MSINKLQISAPLEAGQSLLESKNLPPQLTSALEYVSSRLARKRLHLSLIVVRRNTQIPSIPSSPSTPARSQTSSPARSAFSIASGLKRVSSISTISSETHSAFSSSAPATPSSPSDSFASECPSPTSPNPWGISLMHACDLTPKAEKILRHYIAKAEKKFAIGTGWLASQPLANRITCPATNDLIRRSLAQNSVLFSSEGLTLLALDHIYTFKATLHTYSRTLLQSDLTAAVEELQRLVLAQNGKRITKGYLLKTYEWLGVSLAALTDVNEGYKSTYGGAQRASGIEMQNEDKRSPPPLQTSFPVREAKMFQSRRESPVSPVSNRFAAGRGEGDVLVGESAQGTDGAIEMAEDRGPHYRGAVTPNGWEDVTPVTKGEWLCLLVGEGWRDAKTAPVMTC